jgi:hypothetical protein
MFTFKNYNLGLQNTSGTLRLLRDKPVQDPLGILPDGGASIIGQQQSDNEDPGAFVAPDKNSFSQQFSAPNKSSFSQQISAPDKGSFSPDFSAENRRSINQKVSESKLAQFTPLSTVGRGLGVSLATSKLGEVLGFNDIDNQQQKILDNMSFMSNDVIFQLKKAREEGDQEKVKSLTGILNDINSQDYNLYSDALEDAPSIGQIIGDAAGSALLALGGAAFAGQ